MNKQNKIRLRFLSKLEESKVLWKELSFVFIKEVSSYSFIAYQIIKSLYGKEIVFCNIFLFNEGIFTVCSCNNMLLFS